MPHHASSHRGLVVAAMTAFAAFGGFWGVWGASLPRVRAQAGLDDAALGVALLFVGAGALPAMLVTGRVVDRWGLRTTAPLVAALGASGVVVALAGRGAVSLALALALVGVTSGAADVATNSVAGRAERAAGRPVITRAHAVFSTAVVLGSLGTGALALGGAPVAAPFVVVACLAAGAAVLVARVLPAGRYDAGSATPATGTVPGGSSQGSLPMLTLVGLGLLGALAFASENAHQSWSAILVTDALGTDAVRGALAPATFAAAVAVTRFAAGGLGVAHARGVLVAGSATAAAGAAILAVAPGLAVTLLGLVVAAAGTAVLFPTILAVVSARVDERHRGGATSAVTSLAYLGFVLGPVYVGLWSAEVGIRGAMLAVAALGAVLLVLVPTVVGRASRA